MVVVIPMTTSNGDASCGSWMEMDVERERETGAELGSYEFLIGN